MSHSTVILLTPSYKFSLLLFQVFIQRDYSEGSGVRFQTRFPVELQDKIEREQFEYTVKMMNSMYAEAEKANCSTFCEGKDLYQV